MVTMMPPDSATTPVTVARSARPVDLEGDRRRADRRHHGLDGGRTRHPAQSGIGGRRTGERGDARRGVRTPLFGGAGGHHDQPRCHQCHHDAGGGTADDPRPRAIADVRVSALPGSRRCGRPPHLIPMDGAKAGRRERSTPANRHRRGPSPLSSGSSPDVPWSRPSTATRLLRTGWVGTSPRSVASQKDDGHLHIPRPDGVALR